MCAEAKKAWVQEALSDTYGCKDVPEKIESQNRMDDTLCLQFVQTEGAKQDSNVTHVTPLAFRKLRKEFSSEASPRLV